MKPSAIVHVYQRAASLQCFMRKHQQTIVREREICKFETYINGFLDLEYPNFDTKHGFLSSIEAEIISILLNKAAIFIFDILHPSFNFSEWLPIQIG